MNKFIAALALALAAHSASAAIQYEFRQATQSQVESVPSVEYTGRAIIDGAKSRVDILSGNAYEPGSYVISTNGSKTMTWVNPAKKSFVEINAAGVASAVGAVNIKVENFKHEATQLDDKPVIAGYPTFHYRMTLDYDITVNAGPVPLKQTVHTVTDRWVSPDLEDIADAFLASSSIHTGNADLDQIIDADTKQVKGFPLRQRVVISVTNDTPGMPGSQLAIDRTRTQSREMTITAIHPITAPPTAFIVPPSYHRAEPGQRDDQQTPMKVLTFEPPSGK